MDAHMHATFRRMAADLDNTNEPRGNLRDAVLVRDFSSKMSGNGLGGDLHAGIHTLYRLYLFH